MKKLFLVLLSALVLQSSFGSEIGPGEKKIYADQVLIPIAKTGKFISLAELSRISIKDLQQLTGNKIKFADRLLIKAGQNKLRHSINADGSLNIKKLNKYPEKAKAKDGGSGFHIGGFALGFLLGLIGVLIAYLINDEYKSNRVKWAWIGWLVLVAVLLVALLA